MSRYGGEESVRGTFLEPPEGLDPDCLLFLGDPNKKTYSALQRYWMPVTLSIGFVAGNLFTNLASRMPFRAGMYKHVLYGLFGAALGEGGWRLKCKWTAEKDLQYYHYMVLHPEDFKAPERKKFADVIQPWIPMR